MKISHGSSTDIIITGASIVTSGSLLLDHSLLISEGKIVALLSNQDLPDSAATVIEASAGQLLVPGRIDMHIHGAMGADIMDATPDAFTDIGRALIAEGTTAYLATTLTASAAEIECTMSALSEYIVQQDPIAAQIVGIHLEGPFLSSKFAGAQEQDYFCDPDISLFKHWNTLSGHNIRLVTVAPELSNAQPFIQYLHEESIIASIGHTAATYQQAVEAIDCGCSHATHLYNAMSGFHHRRPGAAAAILNSPQVMAELICDNHHILPQIVDLTYQIKGPEQLVLITDAMRAKCLGDGQFTLGHLKVTVADGSARLDDGTLAGSVLTMQQAVKNMITNTGCDIVDAVQMSSENPARELGLFDCKGSIDIGKDADLVCLNPDYSVEATWRAGQLLFQLTKQS